jgi:hypothetical protein
MRIADAFRTVAGLEAEAIHRHRSDRAAGSRRHSDPPCAMGARHSCEYRTARQFPGGVGPSRLDQAHCIGAGVEPVAAP